MTDTSLVGGVTNAEAGAIARGVREMGHTIKGLREDLAQLEAARAKWASEVNRFRDALWQIAYNVPEHDAETDSSYEEWARSFARETLDDIAF